MRCKACDAPLYNSHDDTYCRKCIRESESMDVKIDSTFFEKSNELKLQLFLTELDKKELVK